MKTSLGRTSCVGRMKFFFACTCKPFIARCKRVASLLCDGLAHGVSTSVFMFLQGHSCFYYSVSVFLLVSSWFYKSLHASTIVSPCFCWCLHASASVFMFTCCHPRICPNGRFQAPLDRLDRHVAEARPEQITSPVKPTFHHAETSRYKKSTLIHRISEQTPSRI
jgi:hypothetical protein